MIVKGRVVYQKCRYEPKSFSWRRPDINNPGQWIYNGALNGVQRVPYRLPELLSSNEDTPIVITEGEKDCDVSLISIGFVATTFGSKEDCLKFLKTPAFRNTSGIELHGWSLTKTATRKIELMAIGLFVKPLSL